MMKETSKKKGQFIIIGIVILSIVATFLFFSTNQKSDQLLFEGSVKNIKKTDEQKKQLTIGVTNPPQESKTYLGNDQVASLTKRLVYEPLLYIKKDLSINYLLADKIDFTNDGLEATIQLNQKAKFSNGDKVTSQDIKNSFMELNKISSTYTQKQICRYIQGMDEYQQGKSKDITGIVISDDSHLTIRFKSLQSANIQALSIPIFKNIKNDQWAIGTGEYTFKKYKHNQSIQLKKNPYAHSSDYNYENILIKSFSTVGMKNDINSYDLDVFEIPLDADLTSIKDAKYHNVYEVKDAYHLNYLQFNLNDQSGEDINIRKAVYHAIDKTVLEKHFDAQEKINNTHLSALYQSHQKNQFDINAAKESYQKVKEKKKQTLTYYVPGDTSSLLRFDSIQSMLKKANMIIQKTSQAETTLTYVSTSYRLPLTDIEMNILGSSLNSSYQDLLKDIYHKDCRNILNELETYCNEQYLTIPISTSTYGLAISSDVNQDLIKDLILNS